MSDMKRLLSAAYMIGYSDARNDKAIDPIGAIERLTMNLNKNDLICRQDAIDVCLNGKCANIYDCADAIKQLPSAERTGKWIPHDCLGQPSIDRDTCSVCGQRFYQIAETGCEWNYCPNCGARMVSEDEC